MILGIGGSRRLVSWEKWVWASCFLRYVDLGILFLGIGGSGHIVSWDMLV